MLSHYQIHIFIILFMYTNYSTQTIIDCLSEAKQNSYVPPQGSQYIIVSGNSGTGKSTLVNLLMDIPLKYEKKKGRNFVITTSKDIESPKIGNQRFATCTTEAKSYRYQENTYIDTPAGKSTESKLKDLEKVAAESNLYLYGRSLKYIFVSDTNQIRAGKPIDFVSNIKHMLTRFDKDCLRQIFESMILVITKFDPNSQQLNTEKDVIETIQAIAESQKNLMVKACLFLLLKSQRIFIIPVPEHKQMQKYVNKIKNCLKNIEYTTLQADFPSYANEQGQYLLRKSIKQLVNQFSQVCSRIQNKIKNKFGVINPQVDTRNLQTIYQAQQLMNSQNLLQDVSAQNKLFYSLDIQKDGAKLLSLINDISFLKGFVQNLQPNYSDIQKIYQALQQCKNRIQDEAKHNFEINQIKQKYIQSQREQQEILNKKRMNIEHQLQKQHYPNNNKLIPNIPRANVSNQYGTNDHIPNQNNKYPIYQKTLSTEQRYLNSQPIRQNPQQNYKIKKQKKTGFFGNIVESFLEVGRNFIEGVAQFFSVSNHRGNRVNRSKSLPFSNKFRASPQNYPNRQKFQNQYNYYGQNQSYNQYQKPQQTNINSNNYKILNKDLQKYQKSMTNDPEELERQLKELKAILAKQEEKLRQLNRRR